MSSEAEISSFDEYWDKENVRFDDSYHKHKETYDLGAASRQDEVSKLQAEVDKLQKRINVALDHAINHGGYDDLTHIINILKGEETK